MKKIGVVGKGKLGSLLLQRVGFFHLNCDLTNSKSIKKAVEEVSPDIIINLAGISSIEECEKHYQKAIDVNVHGVKNLHTVFGDDVVTISTDQVFNGKKSDNSEKSYPSPVNSYGMSKLGAEAVSKVMGGKVIRLSRTVSIEDADISDYLLRLYQKVEIDVSSIMYRNFLHRKLIIDGLVFYLNFYQSMPQMLHYGGGDNLSFYELMVMVADKFVGDNKFVFPRDTNNTSYTPRPMKGGFSVNLARSLGMPMYSAFDTVSELAKEANL